MARILILGGGFGGVVAAESLVKQLGEEHQITLVSRNSRFVFYPALVRLAFGKCQPEDVSFDLRRSMINRRVSFIEAEVAYVEPNERQVILAHGEVEGRIYYDYLIIALGRRLATEHIPGFFEHAHHLLNLEGALKFGKALQGFNAGHAVIGQCPGARLPVPVYETAFALSKWLADNGARQAARITIVSPETSAAEFNDEKIAATLADAMQREELEFLPNFKIAEIGSSSISSAAGQVLNFDLLMALPPFRGSSAVSRLGITDEGGYLNVDWTMRVSGTDRMYAVGDGVNFDGPKMGHMAVTQAEVAAVNLAAEIEGHEAVSHYNHELLGVIDEAGGESIYFHKDMWLDTPASVRHGRFWTWAKRIHEKYWESTHG